MPYKNGGLSRIFNNVATPRNAAVAAKVGFALGKQAANNYRIPTFKRPMGSTSRSAPQSSSSAPITGHYDFKTDYRKRKLTWKKKRLFRYRRRWRKRVLKTVREGTIGSAHFVRRSFAPDLQTSAGLSRSVSWMLYGLNGTNDPNLNTTNDVGQSTYEVSPTDWSNWTSTSLSAVDHKIHAYHGTMEVSIVNTGGNDAWVEVYYIRARNRQDSDWGSPNNVYNTGFLKQGPTIEPDTENQVGAQLTPTELGVTPFQNALFCRMFNIYKRQKFRVPGNGGEISFVTHDRRPRTYSLSSVKPFAWDRGTSGILVQWQGVALGSVGAEAATPAAPTTLAFNVTRRYRFKFPAHEAATDGRN